MKYEGLADGAPVGVTGRREEVEGKDEGQAQQDGHCSKQWRDQEHHDRGADETDQAGVPREIFEGGPKGKDW